MGKIFGANTKISGKVGQLLYRQTRTGTVIIELPVKPAIPRRSARQMDRRTQWGNLAAIYKQFDSMLRRLLFLPSPRFFLLLWAAAPPLLFASPLALLSGGCAARPLPLLFASSAAAPPHSPPHSRGRLAPPPPLSSLSLLSIKQLTNP